MSNCCACLNLETTTGNLKTAAGPAMVRIKQRIAKVLDAGCAFPPFEREAVAEEGVLLFHVPLEPYWEGHVAGAYAPDRAARS